MAISVSTRRLALFVGLLGAGLPGCGTEPVRIRGVVLVVVDTLRADHLGCYGYARPTSPRIDALASEAVLFLEARAPSPWTLPPLGTLMTSLPPSLHRAWSPSQVGDMVWLFEPEAFRPTNALHPSRTTLAEILRAEGFATLGVVQGSYPSAVFGFAQGFDRYDDNATPGIRFDVENVLRWLDEERPQRFFVYLHTIEVHSPYTPVEIQPGLEARLPHGPLTYFREAVREEQERFRRIDFDPNYTGPVTGSRENLRRLGGAGPVPERDLEHLVALYDRGIAYTDYWIGRLLDGLAERGLRDHTLFVLTSDHGEEFLEHGGLEHGRAHYEESLRVPLVMRVPFEGRGRVVHQSVGLVDVTPTILDLLGLERPPAAEGRSLRPLWRDEPLPERDHVAEANIGPRSRALRSGSWKYIRGPVRQELYELRSDPGETRNLCPEERERCRAMSEQLAARNHRLATRAAELALPDPKPAQLDRQMRERLRALGYAEP